MLIWNYNAEAELDMTELACMQMLSTCYDYVSSTTKKFNFHFLKFFFFFTLPPQFDESVDYLGLGRFSSRLRVRFLCTCLILGSGYSGHKESDMSERLI